MELLHGEQVVWRGRPSPRASVAFLARWGTVSLVPGVLATVLSVKGLPTVLALGDWWVVSIVLVLLVMARGARSCAIRGDSRSRTCASSSGTASSPAPSKPRRSRGFKT